MKIYMETFGCTTNHGDATIIRGILEKNQHKIIEDIEEADKLLLITCTVIATTEQRMLHRLRLLKRENKPVIVGGCMASAQAEMVKKIIPNAQLLPPRYIHQINEIVEEKNATYFYQPKTSVPRHIGNTAIIPISEGCQFSCSYCITKKARGELISYPLQEIVNDIRCVIKTGCKEIRITAQDTASYEDVNGEKLPELIEEITKLRGHFMVRIGMMNPISAKTILEKLLETFNNRKIYKFLHLPVQSGSNTILKNMNRGYTTQTFKEIISNFKKRFPDGTIATDIIVAFPGETNKQFSKSCQLIKKIKPDIVNITRFSARPHTKAKYMAERIQTDIAKKRSRKITCLVNQLSKEKNDEKIGKKYKTLIIEKRKNGFVGKTENYKSVYINNGKIGDWVDILITDATPTHLIGEPIKKKDNKKKYDYLY